MIESTVRAICRKEGFGCREISVLSGGQVNQVFLVDGRYVVRIGARENAHARLKAEAECLRSLAGKIPVPEVYAFGELEGLPYQVQQYLPGEKLYLVWKDLTEAEQEAVIADLAHAMKIMHSQPLPAFGAAYETPESSTTWREYLTRNFRSSLEEIDRLGLRMIPGIVEMAAEYFDRHSHVLESGEPVLVHCDLTFVNLLVHRGRLSAILDFEYTVQAPRDYELWAIEAFCLYPNDWAEEEHEVFCTADFAGVFPLLRRHYPAIFETPDLRERMNLYQIDAALGSYLAWRKDNLADIPPETMAAKEFYLGRIGNFLFDHGARLF